MGDRRTVELVTAFRGREAIQRELLRPLFSRFYGTHRARRIDLIAEVRGEVSMKGGRRYDNQYCFVFTFRDGRIVHVCEYGDTDLEERALGQYEDVRPACP